MIKKLYSKFLKENKGYFIIYLLTLLYIPINRLYLPKYYGNFISSLQKKNFDKTKIIFIYLILGWLFIQILNIVSSYILQILKPRFKKYVRQFLFNEIYTRYKNDYQELKLGEIITKFIKTPYILEDVIYIVKDYLIKNILIIISITGYLFYYNLKLGLIFLVFMIFIILLTIRYFHSSGKYYKYIDQQFDYTHEEIEDTLSNLLSIYSARKGSFEKKRISQIDEQILVNDEKLNKCRNKYRVVYTVIFFITICVLNYYSYIIFLNNELDLKTLISIIIMNYSLLDIFMSLYYETNDFIYSYVNINLVIEYITKSLPKKIKQSKTKIPNKYEKGIHVKFENVSFKYKDSKKYSLIDINFEIKPLENIIIMGHVGSGKSTLSKLLIRLLSNYQGNILINGISNNKININNLRYNIVYIPQHPNLFNRTLKENLIYGVDTNKYSIEIMLNKLEEVGLGDIKTHFKNVMNKKVGKLGSKLSGGQRQIVWILRSLFSESKMVILDEPTSSMDLKTKEKIIKLIKELSLDRNLIIITHDKKLLEDNIHNRLIIFKNSKIDKIIKNMK